MKESKDNLLSLQKCKSTEINFNDNKLNNISLTLKSNNSSNIIIAPKKNIKYPPSLSIGLDMFEKYYRNQFSHRYITYVPSLSWAEIYNTPGVFIKDNIKSHSFIASFYQVCILLRFKKNNYTINTKVLCEELNLSEKELETHYEYLIKSGLINKKNSDLILNELFLSENEKINLNYRGLLSGEKKTEENQKEISHFVLEDRKYQIDAAIMHLLKNYKGENMNFDKLKKMICDYVKNFFVPEENIIKSRINNLLERNLIVKTVVNNETLYSYIR
jgi:cullin 3